MCGFGSNQSAPTTQFSTQTTSADPRAAAMYGQAWSNAQNVANRPFTPYSNDPNAFVAPMNATQLSAVNNLYGMQNAGQGYYEQAPAMAYASGNTNAAGLVPQYMSPYLNSVAAATMGILGQQQGQEQNKLSGDIARNGQWGNSRSGVERALLSGQQNLATANTISNLYNTGYNSALGAAQTDLNRQLQASGSLAGQGQTGASNLLQAGTLGQQTQQAGLQALYNQFLMQQQYPFQVAQFLSSTAAGLGPGYGGTTSGYQQSQQPLSFMGNPLSDPALKVGAEGKKPEVIGETNDGQDIYRYRVVNPDTGELGPVQIGLMADEVQQRRPDAIGDYKGFKTVDYAKATDGAARMGGGVTERGDYADGGGIADLLRAHEAMYGGMGERPAGLVPQSQIPTAKLDLPPIHFAEVPKGSGVGLGDVVNTVENGKKLYDQGSSLWDTLEKSNLVSGIFPTHYAGGGGVGVYNEHPDETEGPEVGQMPVAKLEAPQLSFGSDSGQNKSGGLGDMIKGAAGLAGAAKTIFDIGSTVGPALMAFSDRRLKTGVAGYADGGALSDEDNDYVARTLMKEAGGEGQRGMEAVANVIRNRLASGRYGETAKDVVVAPKQFSPWNEEARGTSADPRLADPSSPLYQTAAQISRRVLGGEGEDITGGATHFYNPKLANPKWAAGKEGLDIGNHRFLSADAGAGVAPGRALALAPSEERPSTPALDAISSKPAGLAPAEDLSPAQGISGMIRGAPASGMGERALDFATSERFLVPLLTGLGAMASSGSRYLAPAVLQGLGAGAQAYMQVPKTQAETAKLAEEARTQKAVTGLRQAEIPFKEAETKFTTAETKKTEAETANNAIFEKNGRLFVRYVKPNGFYGSMSFGEWNAADPANRPPLDPAEVEKAVQSHPAEATPSSTESMAPTSGAISKPEVAPPSGEAGGFSPNTDQIKNARKLAIERSGYSMTNLNAIPDFFAPQASIAKAAQDQKQIIVPLAASLAKLPKDSSLLASGKAQEFLSPLASQINNLAAAVGLKARIAKPEDLASQEEVKKLVSQLQREAVTSTQIHALGALQEMAQGIPGIFTSPSGQGKLIAQVMTNNQRQIDKNDYFMKWSRGVAGEDGRLGEWARFTSPEANSAFDNDKGTNARYAKDREELEKLFNQKVTLTDDQGLPVMDGGKPKKTSMLAAISDHPEILRDPEYRKAFEQRFSKDILRYFGIQ